VGITDFVTPVSSSDGYEIQFRLVDARTDGGGNLFASLHSQTNVAIGVTDNNESLESVSLTGTGLLLDQAHFHNFVLQFSARWEKFIDDLMFLDGQGEQVNFLKPLDLRFVNHTAQLGDGHPLGGFLLATAASATATTAASVASTTAAFSASTSAFSASTSAHSSSFGCRHSDDLRIS
jgi:hypothetical protein